MMDGRLQRRAEGSRAQSEASLDAEYDDASVNYHYWIAWLRWYGDREVVAARDEGD